MCLCLCVCVMSKQDMTSAVITPCSHFFHAGCLKKWLYVQETCPLCHSQLKTHSQLANPAHIDAPANQNPAELGQGEPAPAAPVAQEGIESAPEAVCPEPELPVGTAAASSSSSTSSTPTTPSVEECQESSSCSEPGGVDGPSPNEEQKCHGGNQPLAMIAGVSA